MKISFSDGALLLKWDGDRWSAQTSGTTLELTDVFGFGPNNVWAIGQSGTLLRWNGTAWSPQATGTTNNLHAIWGTSANNLWIAGDAGLIL